MTLKHHALALAAGGAFVMFALSVTIALVWAIIHPTNPLAIAYAILLFLTCSYFIGRGITDRPS